jgi:uncharacterized membrane protein YgdD (TMEM256/DUF423 family)
MLRAVAGSARTACGVRSRQIHLMSGSPMRVFDFLGALFCFLGVVAGAVGSHTAKALLNHLGTAANYDLATHYMFYHGIGLLFVGQLSSRYPDTKFHWAGWLFVVGTVLFQGNLYLISLTGIRAFLMLTPLGGLCLMLAWLLMALMALHRVCKP